MTYNLIESTNGGYQPRGAAALLWSCKDHEVVIEGPAETGKTLAILHKLDALMWKYPGAQSAIVRKTYKSLHGSVLQTYKNKVLLKETPIKAYGGERPERYIYPNGSEIWLGGMDNPDKVLSSERDVIFVNQVEELRISDWETLSTRTTGRAGNMPYSQMIGDCNPAGAKHWIREHAATGKLTLLHSVHQDNPTLYDEAGNLTEQGIRTMGTLSNLTGVRRDRLYLGKWTTAEGLVYDNFNFDIHVQERDPAEFISWGLALDEGYTNPAVDLLIGTDSDGRIHVAQEWYERGKLQTDVVAQAEEWYRQYDCRLAAVDAAAAGLIADLRNNNIQAEPHKGRVLDGIALVQNRLAVQGDGRSRLTIDPSCVNTINEFESYVWREGKDEPVKDNDHAMDALRYYCVATEQDTGSFLFGV